MIAALAAQPEICAAACRRSTSRDLHDAVVILDGDPAVLHLGDDQFLERLQSYLDLAPALRERVPDIDYVDLRFDERMYVRPRDGVRRGRSRAASGSRVGQTC